MDTKLTRMRNSKILKIILILLSCILFAECYFTGQELYAFYENNYNVNGIYSLKAASTPLGNCNSAFAKQIRSDTGKVRKFISTYGDKTKVEDGSAFLKTEKNIKARYDSIATFNIVWKEIDFVESHYEYDYSTEEYYYSYLPTSESDKIIIHFSSEQQIDADNRITDFGYGNRISGLYKDSDGQYFYKGFPILQGYTDVDYDAERSENARLCEEEIKARRASFAADFEQQQNYLANLKNYQYYFLDKNTGEVYTNIDPAPKNIIELISNYDDNNFTASVVGGNFKISQTLRGVLEGKDGWPWYINGYGDMIDITDSYQYYDYCFGTMDPDRFDCYVHVNLKEATIAKNKDAYNDLYSMQMDQIYKLSTNVETFIIEFALWILTLVLLIVFTNPKLTFLDKIPNSIHFCLAAVLVTAAAILPMLAYMETVGWNTVFSPSRPIAYATVFANLLFVEWLMSVRRQVMNKQFFKNTLIYMLIVKNWPKIKSWLNVGISKITHGEIKRRIFLVFLVYLVLMLFFAILPFIARFGLFPSFALMVILSIVAFLYIKRLAKGLDAIASALTKAETGDYNFSVPVYVMPDALKPMGEKVNNLTSGLNIAIEDALKNERTKAELITNVSHDLKTPLTSIITYTDLLKQCDIEDATACEYINVLDEKSARLKKLIEDLVEASKASSGNVTLNLVEINLNELTEQVFGEYEDTLDELKLDLKMNTPSEPIYVVADGQKTYRIIENLFSNVKKYALPGTRVYLDLSEENGEALLQMKNISREEMNFDAEHLTERFVRGEDSRTTEGSGLGLSIAKSLTELQGGKFDITIDGDLFKVVIKLPLKK